ncbi:MAG: hypothetical protein K2X93_03450 [Candidatus Obscuribacterales bacterium]|nr:hypothetical protein [Candidatus Obscuribacterales bacterium]
MTIESNNAFRRADETAIEPTNFVQPIHSIISPADNRTFFEATRLTTLPVGDDDIESGGTTGDDDDDEVLDAGGGYSFVHAVRPQPWDSNDPRRLSSSGFDFENSGNMQNAQRCYEALVRMYESGGRDGQPQHLQLASAWEDLARVQLRSGNLDGAEASLVRSLQLNQTHREVNDPQLAYSHERLGDLYQSSGRELQATQHYRASVSILERNGNPSNLREARMRLASNLQITNGHEDAIRTLRQVIEARGANPAQQAEAHALLSYSLARTGDHRGSAASLDLALEYRRRNGQNPDVDRAIVRTLTGLAELDMPNKKTGTGDIQAVFRRLEQADSITRETFGDNSPEFARARARLGMARTRNGDDDVGELLLRHSLAIQERGLGDAHADTLHTRQALIDNLTNNNNGAAALELANRQVDLTARARGANHPAVADAAEQGIRAARSAGEPFVAIAMAQRAANVRREQRAQSPDQYMYALAHLATLEQDAGLSPNALATTTLMVGFAREAYRNNPEQLSRALSQHASVLRENGLEDDANRVSAEADRIAPQRRNAEPLKRR